MRRVYGATERDSATLVLESEGHRCHRGLCGAEDLVLSAGGFQTRVTDSGGTGARNIGDR